MEWHTKFCFTDEEAEAHLRIYTQRRSLRGAMEMNLTNIHEDVDSIPGLAQLRGSGVAVAVVQAGSCSSNSIPGLAQLRGSGVAVAVA